MVLGAFRSFKTLQNVRPSRRMVSKSARLLLPILSFVITFPFLIALSPPFVLVPDLNQPPSWSSHLQHGFPISQVSMIQFLQRGMSCHYVLAQRPGRLTYLSTATEIPDTITIEQFMNDEKYGRLPLNKARHPYTCGLTGRSYTAAQVAERTDLLSRAIAENLGLDPHQGTEWDRVVYLYSANTIDYMPLMHAIHRLSGIVTLASTAYTVDEVKQQLLTTRPKALFTCATLLDGALEAAKAIGLPNDRVFLLPLPGVPDRPSFKTIEDLVVEGEKLAPLKPLIWVKGQGARQTALLSFSSGTSGLPKAVMISHYNLIANMTQVCLFDSIPRADLGIETQVILGVLPFSHVYGIYVCLSSQYRGDQVIVLPRYELKTLLNAVQKFQIEYMFIVPPMLIQLLSSEDVVAQYDLSSVRVICCAAAPLGQQTVVRLQQRFPSWHIGQAYGMTECSPVLSTTSEIDLVSGSSGSLLPGTLVKLIDANGREVTTLETRGEIYIQSPSLALGYFNNNQSTSETFLWQEDGRWLRTGDEGLFRTSPNGHEHIVIVDRIKELIKTKGHQVSPAELESHLLTHDFVDDCAVIQVPDIYAGEVPKAFVVKSKAADAHPPETVVSSIIKHVEEHKARHKWLAGGVELIDAIPKNPSGKILRRLLRDQEKAARRGAGAKL